MFGYIAPISAQWAPGKTSFSLVAMLLSVSKLKELKYHGEVTVNTSRRCVRIICFMRVGRA